MGSDGIHTATPKPLGYITELGHSVLFNLLLKTKLVGENERLFQFTEAVEVTGWESGCLCFHLTEIFGPVNDG